MNHEQLYKGHHIITQNLKAQVYGSSRYLYGAQLFLVLLEVGLHLTLILQQISIEIDLSLFYIKNVLFNMVHKLNYASK